MVRGQYDRNAPSQTHHDGYHFNVVLFTEFNGGIFKAEKIIYRFTGVYILRQAPPPPGGGMIIHQGKENSKYVQFFKKLRKNGDKRRKIMGMGMQTYVFVD